MQVDQLAREIGFAPDKRGVHERDHSRPVVVSVDGLSGQLKDVERKVTDILRVIFEFVPSESSLVIVPGAVPAIIEEVASIHQQTSAAEAKRGKVDPFVAIVASRVENLFATLMKDQLGDSRDVVVQNVHMVPDLEALIATISSRQGNIYWPNGILDEDLDNLRQTIQPGLAVIAGAGGGLIDGPTIKGRKRILIHEGLTAEMIAQRIGADVLIIITESDQRYFPPIKGKIIEPNFVPSRNNASETDPRLLLNFRAAQRHVLNADVGACGLGSRGKVIHRLSIVSSVEAIGELTRNSVREIAPSSNGNGRPDFFMISDRWSGRNGRSATFAEIGAIPATV